MRPVNPELASDEDWFDYIYVRDNPRGIHQEYWQHIAGCRSYVKVLRNTVTHEVLKTGLPSDDLLSSGEAE
jgi:sarcosine oxidase subunit delta